MTWIVARSELLSASWYLDSVEITSGTATVSLKVVEGSTVKYLSSDLTNLTSTPTEIALVYSAVEKWSRILSVPSSMTGMNVNVVYTHSNAQLPRLSEELHLVLANDPTTNQNGANMRGL